VTDAIDIEPVYDVVFLDIVEEFGYGMFEHYVEV